MQDQDTKSKSSGRFDRRYLVGTGLGAVAVGAATWIWQRRMKRLPKVAGELVAVRVTGALPLEDPMSELWESAAPCRIPLLPQQMFYPRLGKATLDSLLVRALFDGDRLGLLLEWDDSQADVSESIATFRDAAAVMIPASLEDVPPIFMGMKNQPVHILHWKSSWQRDLDQKFQDVTATYVNAHNELYPGLPELERFGMTQKAALSFYPGRAAGNPLSQDRRTSSVEQLVAQGFGTLTTSPTQSAHGRGVRAKKGWKVALGTPVRDDSFPSFSGVGSVPLAFAIWDGGKQQVGGRKHYANWTAVKLRA